MTTFTNVDGFNNSFTSAFRDELRTKLEQNLPPRPKSVATLPCEMF